MDYEELCGDLFSAAQHEDYIERMTAILRAHFPESAPAEEEPKDCKTCHSAGHIGPVCADCIESGTYRHYTPDELDEALPVGDLGEKPVTLIFGGPPTPYDWPDDFHLENGKYTCRCLDCGRFFFGHKRRLQCRVCAEKPYREADARALLDAVKE